MGSIRVLKMSRDPSRGVLTGRRLTERNHQLHLTHFSPVSSANKPHGLDHCLAVVRVTSSVMVVRRRVESFFPAPHARTRTSRTDSMWPSRFFPKKLRSLLWLNADTSHLDVDWPSLGRNFWNTSSPACSRLLNAQRQCSVTAVHTLDLCVQYSNMAETNMDCTRESPRLRGASSAARCSTRARM